jgi:hypothetical protein
MTDQDKSPDSAQDPGTNSTNGLITIYVNRHPFRVARRPVTGAVLKEMPTPPIGPDSDLIRIMHGGESDLFVQPDEVVELEDGTEFFAVPRTIMAGASGIPRRPRSSKTGRNGPTRTFHGRATAESIHYGGFHSEVARTSR